MVSARYSIFGAGLPASRLPLSFSKARGTDKNICARSEGFTLPPEILLEIAQSTPSTRDIVALCLTSRDHHRFLLPSLYASVSCKTLGKCQERLKFLLRRPDLAGHVQSLVVRPYDVQSEDEENLDQALAAEREVSRAIELLAPKLSNLKKFIWDGQQMPEDSLWRTLRLSCPHLNYVGSSVGTEEIKSESELFAFNDLVGFSFKTKLHELDFHALPPIGVSIPSEPLPGTLWDMLLTRCPRLEELSLGGEGSVMTTRLLDVRPLTRAYWPALRRLTLGTVLVLDRDASDDDKEQITIAFSEFLSDHLNLKQLDTPYHTRLPCLDITGSDIVLESFSGSLPYLMDIIRACKLKKLSLCAEEHAAWYITYVRKVLKVLPFLTSLEIWIDLTYHHDPKANDGKELPEKRDHIGLLRDILSDCPKLEHFKVICSTKKKLTFPMRDISNALIGGPALKSLEVYKVYASGGEEQMIQSTTRIFRQLSSLDSVILRYSKNQYSNFTETKIRQEGFYNVVLRGPTGKPVRALVRESGRSFFKDAERRYEYDLRPLRKQIMGAVTGRD